MVLFAYCDHVLGACQASHRGTNQLSSDFPNNVREKPRGSGPWQDNGDINYNGIIPRELSGAVWMLTCVQNRIVRMHCYFDCVGDQQQTQQEAMNSKGAKDELSVRFRRVAIHKTVSFWAGSVPRVIGILDFSWRSAFRQPRGQSARVIFEPENSCFLPSTGGIGITVISEPVKVLESVCQSSMQRECVHRASGSKFASCFSYYQLLIGTVDFPENERLYLLGDLNVLIEQAGPNLRPASAIINSLLKRLIFLRFGHVFRDAVPFHSSAAYIHQAGNNQFISCFEHLGDLIWYLSRKLCSQWVYLTPVPRLPFNYLGVFISR
ncbi:hypothetical protein EV424DRAFT_1345851 [Suillus variegatus]|nr:hypothetical protein EV424DRAFT_1345851 [Suillus variegatus]